MAVFHYFEDFPEGFQYETPKRTIFETDVVNFVALAGLYEDLFCNLEYIENESPIRGGRFAPAALVWGMAQGLGIRTGLYEKTFVAILGVNNMRIPKPILVGDTIHVQATVLSAQETSKGDKGVLNSRFDIVNQHGDVVMHYEMQHLVLKRPAAGE